MATAATTTTGASDASSAGAGAGARYYDEHLSADRLRLCYACAPPRAQQYLAAEVAHATSRLRPADRVLELGCGYGRVLLALAPHCSRVVGVDTSAASVAAAREALRAAGACNAAAELMDAGRMAWAPSSYDVVLCLQNGVSAMGVGLRALLAECLRVARAHGGRVLLSSYAEGFWEARLEWFEAQARAGLVGRIDWARTGGGVIVCDDGFSATTVRPREFEEAARAVVPAGATVKCYEVDGSSSWCEIVLP
eukprot:m51a1_g10159 hypothetical protein (252) ;mRNA; f:26478-27233